MVNIVDALVVTLELDPKKFGSGAQAAQKKLTEFNAAVKKLGIDETKLSDVQKKRVETLHQTEVQSARTGKELKSTETISKGLFSTLEKGALGFGAALGVYGFKEFATQAVASGAAVAQLSRTLGMGAHAADTWGKAITLSVNGSAESMLGTLQSVSDELHGWQSGGSIDRLLKISAILSRYNGGKAIPLFGANKQPLPEDEVLKSFADPIKAMGAQNAHALLGGIFPDDVINFELQGRSGVETALRKAAAYSPSDKNFDDDLKLQQSANELAAAFNSLKLNLLGLIAPKTTLLFKNATVYARSLRGEITADEATAAIRQNDAEANATPDDPGGKKWLAKQDAEAALSMVKDPPTGGADGTSLVPPMYKYGARLPTFWNRDQKLARINQLIADGMSPQQAAGYVTAEMAAGRAPGAQTPVVPLGGGAGSGNLLDAIKSVESGGNPNAVSSAGARGAYQLMPGTMKQYGVTDATSEAQERDAAGRYMADLQAKYGNLRQALAAYNWGPGNLDRDIQDHGSQWDKYLPAETAAYIPKVMAAMAGGAGGPGATTTINQNGPVTINTAATDAHGIAKDWHKAVVAQTSGGPS